MQGVEDSLSKHCKVVDHGVFDPVAAEAMRVEDEDIYDPIVVEKRRAQKAFAQVEDNKARQAFEDARTRAIRNYEKQNKKDKEKSDVPNERDVNIAEVIYPQEALMSVEVQRYILMTVVLDSGAGAHVINQKACPGYVVEESEMSKAGVAFRGADGGRIANLGQVTLNMVAGDSTGCAHKITSKFEVADVTRALWSVGLICDSGLDVVFTKSHAYVKDAKGMELCVFTRTNGLYVSEVKIENPRHPDFGRRE